MSVEAEPVASRNDRVRAAVEELRRSSIGEEVAGWRHNAIAAGRSVTGADQRQFALSVIHRRLRVMAERDIANGVGALSPAEDDAVAVAVLDDMFGAGALDRLLADPLVENIDAIGCDRVWVSYADGRKALGPQLWRTDAEMIEHLRRLGARVGQNERRFDHASVELNLQLPSGARLFAVMAVTARPCVSVRRHRKASATLTDLRDSGTLDGLLEGFLAAVVRARLNILIAGGTNAGKTTLLRALLAETDSTERLVTIEDNRELNLSACLPGHLDVVEMEARDANTEGMGAVSMAELVRMGLRMNPSRVIVGEVRGAEVIPMLNAMSQGNDGSMCTIHASGSDGVFDRVAAYCVQAPEHLDRVASNLLAANAVDLVVFLSHTTTPDGAPLRRVASVREVVGAEDHHVVTNEIFRLDHGDDTATATGVPLRPGTAERLRAVGYAWPPLERRAP
jgi:Flp pilus assembly CpaF family ATPase